MILLVLLPQSGEGETEVWISEKALLSYTDCSWIGNFLPRKERSMVGVEWVGEILHRIPSCVFEF